MEMKQAFPGDRWIIVDDSLGGVMRLLYEFNKKKAHLNTSSRLETKLDFGSEIETISATISKLTFTNVKTTRTSTRCGNCPRSTVLGWWWWCHFRHWLHNLSYWLSVLFVSHCLCLRLLWQLSSYQRNEKHKLHNNCCHIKSAAWILVITFVQLN